MRAGSAMPRLWLYSGWTTLGCLGLQVTFIIFRISFSLGFPYGAAALCPDFGYIVGGQGSTSHFYFSIFHFLQVFYTGRQRLGPA